MSGPYFPWKPCAECAPHFARIKAESRRLSDAQADDTITFLRHWALTSKAMNTAALVVACLDEGEARHSTQAETMGFLATELTKLAASLERRFYEATARNLPTTVVVCPRCVPPGKEGGE